MEKKTLVVGASLKEGKYSNIAIKKLIANKHEVKAIGLRKGKIGEVKIDTGFPKLNDIDTVTLYLQPSRQKGYYEYIIALKPNRVIFNPGTKNFEFIELLESNTIEVEIACTLVLLTIDQY